MLRAEYGPAVMELYGRFLSLNTSEWAVNEAAKSLKNPTQYTPGEIRGLTFACFGHEVAERRFPDLHVTTPAVTEDLHFLPVKRFLDEKIGLTDEFPNDGAIRKRLPQHPDGLALAKTYDPFREVPIHRIDWLCEYKFRNPNFSTNPSDGWGIMISQLKAFSRDYSVREALHIYHSLGQMKQGELLAELEGRDVALPVKLGNPYSVFYVFPKNYAEIAETLKRLYEREMASIRHEPIKVELGYTDFDSRVANGMNNLLTDQLKKAQRNVAVSAP